MKYSVSVMLTALCQMCLVGSMCWASVFAQELLNQVHLARLIFCEHAVKRDVTHK